MTSAPNGSREAPLLSATNLVKVFRAPRFGGNGDRQKTALNDVTFAINAGVSTGIVGESGCGKTTLARVLGRLVSPTSGRVYLGTEDVTDWRAGRLRHFRSTVRIMFQNPDSALNPRLTVRQILSEAVQVQERTRDGREREERVRELVSVARLGHRHLDTLASRLSGGEKRRVMLARSIAGSPSIIIADEPVSGLDLSIQRDLLELLDEVRRQRAVSFAVITHDLSILGRLCQRIAVMKSGRVVEDLSTSQLMNGNGCHHPYTDRLRRSSISLQALRENRQRPRPEGPGNGGTPHGPADAPVGGGCIYRAECARYRALGSPAVCGGEEPNLAEVAGSVGHRVACHFSGSDPGG